MVNISKIDKNFEVKTAVDGLCIHNIKSAPFKIYGVMWNETNGNFERIPENIAKATSEGVTRLYKNTAGGRVRFMTDSAEIGVYVSVKDLGKMPHFALTGSIGVDLYDDDEGFLANFAPPFNVTDFYSTSKKLRGGKKMRTLTLNMPLYTSVTDIEIGIEKDAVLLPASDYKDVLPIVYYGSSITQGGCASRPGNCYQNIITRKLNIDHINLGFSGNAKGEPVMAKYIADLDMSAFVLDYDHNAPTPEHLQKTHKPFYDIIRCKNPELPIIIVSRPTLWIDDEVKRRLEIITQSYIEAKAAGDNVYFIDGTNFFKKLGGDSATIDGCHPNDLGFMAMADGIYDVLKNIYK